MKKVIIIAAMIFGVSSISFAQEKVNNSAVKTVKVDNRTDAEKIASCKYQIASLDKKEEWIRSNPEEYKIALEQGWFENAAKTRKELKSQIAEIENKNK